MRNPGTSYDHILIESSGISEPRAVRDNFQDAEVCDFFQLLPLLFGRTPLVRMFLGVSMARANHPRPRA